MVMEEVPKFCASADRIPLTKYTFPVPRTLSHDSVPSSHTPLKITSAYVQEISWKTQVYGLCRYPNIGREEKCSNLINGQH